MKRGTLTVHDRGGSIPVVPLDLSPDGYPMAPSQDAWDKLSAAEQAEVYASIPAEITEAEFGPPEGDPHFRPKVAALDALGGYFRRNRRKIYLAAELPTYYPNEPRFAPDLLAVMDVEDHERGKWVVSAEGRGLDWVLEVHVSGNRKKDAEENVERYARLGIPEYFFFDRSRNTLIGYRLASPEARTYSPIVPQGGRYASHVLGLELQLEEDQLRFFAGTALVLSTTELNARLEGLLAATQKRADAEARGREEEVRRREEAEREVARLREELARLR